MNKALKPNKQPQSKFGQKIGAVSRNSGGAGTVAGNFRWWFRSAGSVTGPFRWGFRSAGPLTNLFRSTGRLTDLLWSVVMNLTKVKRWFRREMTKFKKGRVRDGHQRQVSIGSKPRKTQRNLRSIQGKFRLIFWDFFFGNFLEMKLGGGGQIRGC
jgi:hypothetical protein